MRLTEGLKLGLFAFVITSLLILTFGTGRSLVPVADAVTAAIGS